MARKIKTKSPKQPTGTRAMIMDPIFRASLDLCKINTARIRALSVKQLETAQRKVGAIHRLPKKESGGFRRLLSSFMNNLANAKRFPTSERDVSYENHRRYPADYIERSGKKYTDEQLQADIAHNKRMKAMYFDEADRTERKIWDLQQQAGCKLPDQEIVARDAERLGQKDTADKLRAERRRPPTPHKRPAKIR